MIPKRIPREPEFVIDQTAHTKDCSTCPRHASKHINTFALIREERRGEVQYALCETKCERFYVLFNASEIPWQTTALK